MQRATVDATSHVNINLLAVDQDLSSCELFVADGQAERRTVVFVEDVRVSVALEQALQHSVITLGCRIMQRCSLPVVLVVHFEVFH